MASRSEPSWPNFSSSAAWTSRTKRKVRPMQTKKLFKSFFSDWPAKVLSLVLALFLTLFFQLTRLEQRSLNIPLSVSVNDEMAPSSEYPQTIKVTLRGERDAIYAVGRMIFRLLWILPLSNPREYIGCLFALQSGGMHLRLTLLK